MEEALKVNQLISEKKLAEALKTSKQTLYQWRRKGCPWLSIGGKAYYYEPALMAWILEKCKRVADSRRDITGEDQTDTSVDPT